MPAVPTRNPIRRLDSINKSTLGRPKLGQRGAPAKKATCCDDPKIEEEDGMKVCRNCFTQISESNIVADVTFQEDSRGAATVQGGFVGENARHARTLGSSAFRRIGGGERNTQQEVEDKGRRALNAICPRLSVPDTVQQQALAIWVLSANHNFHAGRKTDEVVAACLYAACRRQKENTILLMDISELQRINVFRLGEVYKDLVKDLFLGGDAVGIQHLIEVEPLIMKYCRKLEFGGATRQVAEDAIKIIRRMKRDWMVTGRHPAGLCGACIILAARMNNFRRSVREVVYVAKVADLTISKRIEEFRRTKSAALTVDQFREFGVRLKHQHDPPVLQYSMLQLEKFEAKKRKRQEASEQRDTIEISDRDSEASSRAPSATPGVDALATTIAGEDGRKRQRIQGSEPNLGPIQQQLRYDADGFAIPALPVDTGASSQSDPPKRKRGRPRKEELPPPIPVSEDELIEERELEEEIEEVLQDDQVLDSLNEVEQAKAEERARVVANQQKQLAAEKTQERRDAEGVTWWRDKGSGTSESVTAEDLEAEFADDPEVINCQLTNEEQKIKEQIWVTHNEDWLRSQHEKELIKKIAEASGDRDRTKRGAKGGKRKKRSKMGDGTLLTEAGTPIETPADASAAMVAKRAPPAFSKYVNYEALAKVYGGSPSTSTTASRAGSEVQNADGRRADSPSSRGTPVASPTPAGRGSLLSPPSTQQAPTTAGASTRTLQPPPASPPPTQPAQAQVIDGAPVVEDEEYEVDEYASEARSQAGGWGEEESDCEDIGEEHFGLTLDRLGRTSLHNSLDDNEDEDYI